MSKKYEAAVEDERVSNSRKISKLEGSWKMKVEAVEANCKRKDGLIEELRQKINESEREKC